MSIVVQKFGGALLATPAKIRHAAAYICESKLHGEEPVVVVSAPGKVTDHFIRLAGRVAEKPDPRELDMLLSVGERMGMSLLAMAINAYGSYQAVSFTGSQVGIITDTRHTDASIIEVKGYRIREAIQQGMIPIVAGFQGISTAKEITTLGRGGSDATAVALAAAIGAERCELVKESGGVFTADPVVAPEARLIPEIDYTTLESITASGAKIVQPRAAALAKEHYVNLAITAPDGQRGTLVSDRSLTRSAVAAITLQAGRYLARIGNAEVRGETAFWADDAGGVGVFETPLEGGRKVDLVNLIGWGAKLPDNAANCALERASGVVGYFRSPGVLAIAVEAGAGAKIARVVHSTMLAAGFFGSISGGSDGE